MATFTEVTRTEVTLSAGRTLLRESAQPLPRPTNPVGHNGQRPQLQYRWTNLTRSRCIVLADLVTVLHHWFGRVPAAV
jgi:hypothetical protein